MSPRQALTALASPHRYRVRLDAEGWPIIPGRYGRLEWHDGTTLAVYTDHPRLFARLWAVPGIRRWQVGDREARALLPIEVLPEVAALIQARRRRILSSEAARQKGAGTAYRATSRRRVEDIGAYRVVVRWGELAIHATTGKPA